MHWKVEALQKGKPIITSEKGNSMTPRIKSGQEHELSPVESWEECGVGDVVFCKVKGNYYTHLVTGKQKDRGLCISNNHGHVNGWTKIVYGKVTKIF
jgi:hypothetical protein